MKLTELFLNRFLYRDNTQNLETKDSVFVSADSTPAEPSPIYSGGAAQDINTGNVQINGAQLEPGTFPQTVLDVSNWGWGQTCAFSSTDLNTVSWGAGTFKSADGTSYSISAGNTGNMAAKTYIYLDLLTSTTAYQITTTPGTAVGVGKVLVAVANPDTTTATYNLSEATQIVGDNILANSINASKITTGQLVVGTNVGLGTAFPSSSAGSLAYLSLVETAQLGSTVIVGGYIKTSLLSADNIQTGTITIDPGNSKVSALTAKYNGSSVVVIDASGVKVNGQNFFVYDIACTTQYGYIGGYGGYMNFKSVAGRNILIGVEGGQGQVIFDSPPVPSADLTYACGIPGVRWSYVYSGGYFFDISHGLTYSSSAIQSNSNFRVSGSIYLTGNLIFENAASITINGVAFYVTADPDAAGKYYLRS